MSTVSVDIPNCLLRHPLRRTSVVSSLYSTASLSTNIFQFSDLTNVSHKKYPIILGFKRSSCSECCILFVGDSLTSEFYMPSFREHPVPPPICSVSSTLHMGGWNRHNVPKRRHIKFRRRRITQRKNT